MTNRISERIEEANALSQQPNETDFCLIEATMDNIEWATEDSLVLTALDESLAEFDSLYAELAK